MKEVKEVNQKLILALERQLKESEQRHLRAVESLKKEVISARWNEISEGSQGELEDVRMQINRLLASDVQLDGAGKTKHETTLEGFIKQDLEILKIIKASITSAFQRLLKTHARLDGLFIT
jgi:hypothetical protein